MEIEIREECVIVKIAEGVCTYSNTLPETFKFLRFVKDKLIETIEKKCEWLETLSDLHETNDESEEYYRAIQKATKKIEFLDDWIATYKLIIENDSKIRIMYHTYN
jgi:hypothetical protein